MANYLPALRPLNQDTAVRVINPYVCTSALLYLRTLRHLRTPTCIHLTSSLLLVPYYMC